jgi:predicted small secreted protein
MRFLYAKVWNFVAQASVEPTIGGCRRGTWRIDMKASFAALAFLLAVAASACNTVEGVGEDVTAAGQAVDNAAEDAAN